MGVVHKNTVDGIPGSKYRAEELFCTIQLEDSMPPATVYLPSGSLQFHIPSEDDFGSRLIPQLW